MEKVCREMKTSLIFLVALLCTGCSGLTGDEISTGIEACKSRGGVRYFYGNFFGYSVLNVQCNDGIHFVIPQRKKLLITGVLPEE